MMNKGLGHLHGKDGSGGMNFLTRSLRACANYFPSIQLVQRIQKGSQAKKA